MVWVLCTTSLVSTTISAHQSSTPALFHIRMESSSTSSPNKKILVCGGGVIGVCTAYFLAKRGAQVTLVEKSGIACAASGKAGGFLASDWCDDSPVSSLARASFLLHQQLADELDGPAAYGYRRLNTLSIGIQEQPTSNLKQLELIPSWVDGDGAFNPVSIGTPQTTAQVHPQLFTRAVLSAAVEKYGVKVVIGEVQKVELERGNVVCGVVVDGELVQGDVVVLALGPWSSKNEVISGLFTISGLKVHSIVLRPQNPEAIGPHALFLKYTTAQGRSMDPDVFPRPTVIEDPLVATWGLYLSAYTEVPAALGPGHLAENNLS